MKYKILLIDNNLKNATFFKKILASKKNIDFLYFEKNTDIKNITEEIGFKNFDLIIINIFYKDFTKVINSLKNNLIPILILIDNKNKKYIEKAYSIGAWNYITIKENKKIIYKKIESLLTIKDNLDNLVTYYKEKELEALSLGFEKKIFSTALDILYHDTKNIFFNINSLLSETPDYPLKPLLEESINDLFETTMEAVSFVQNKKRINSLVDLIEKIRVTKDRIYIKDFQRITFNYENSKYLYYIESSPLIKNAIANVIENAIKYSEDLIKIKLERIEDKIFISVSDRGKGIANEEKSMIFNRYYRCKNTDSIEGTGLGLSIVQNIIERESGVIKIEDNPEGGTIITIKLNAYKVDNKENGILLLSKWFDIPVNLIKEREDNISTLITLNNNEHKITDIDTYIFVNLLDILRKEKIEKSQIHIQQRLESIKKRKGENNKKVLVIDDSIYVQYYLGTFFSELGYSVIGFASNGKDGIDLFKSYKPDLVSIDYTMPIMNGIDTAEIIYNLNKEIKIIFITAMGENKIFTEKLDKKIPKNIYKVLTKPIKKENIKKALINFV